MPLSIEGIKEYWDTICLLKVAGWIAAWVDYLVHFLMSDGLDNIWGSGLSTFWAVTELIVACEVVFPPIYCRLVSLVWQRLSMCGSYPPTTTLTGGYLMRENQLNHNRVITAPMQTWLTSLTLLSLLPVSSILGWWSKYGQVFTCMICVVLSAWVPSNCSAAAPLTLTVTMHECPYKEGIRLPTCTVGIGRHT